MRVTRFGRGCAWALALALVAMTLLSAGGCESDDGPTLADFPKLSQVRSRVPPKHEDAPSPQGSAPRARLVVREIVMPIEYSTRGAWDLIETSMFPQVMRQAWRGNGIRIGVLALNDAAKLRKALPPILRVGRRALWASDHPSQLLRAPQQPEPIMLDRSMLVSGEEQTQALEGGRLQLMARVRRDGRGQLVVHIIPHHYRPQMSLKPRDPLRKELDGTLFSDLTLRVPQPRGQFIVLGLHRSVTQPPPDDSDEGSDSDESSDSPEGGDGNSQASAAEAAETGEQSGGDESEQSGESPANEKPTRIAQPLDLPAHMGRAMFTGRELGRPVQVITLIQVQSLQ